MNDALALHIGQRIRKRRRMFDLSQAALGERCGCSFQTIHKYEVGIVQMPAAVLYTLARALEVPASYFFDGFEDFDAARGTAPALPGNPGAGAWAPDGAVQSMQ